MGQDDDLNASLAHIVLCCVGGNGLSHIGDKNFTQPGMHANFFLHGIIGFLHYQSGRFNNDFGPMYAISLHATRYLALPCLMADLYHSDKGLSTLHLITGLLPFTMALAGQDNPHLGNLCIAGNIVSLAYYSIQNDKQWGLYCAGAGLLAYFAAPASGVKVIYPLTLALMEYCAYRMFRSAFDAPDPNQRRR